MEGKAIIFSAPSGSGKTSIVRQLLASIPSLKFSISSTTRAKRAGEVHGKDYYFLSLMDFRKRIELGEFLEWEEVYKDTLYGTSRSEVDKIWAKGGHVVFDVDVKGGLKLKKALKDKALSVFVKVPTVEELEKRLRERNTEDEHSLRARIDKAKQEMLDEPHFDVVVLNENLEDAVENAHRLVTKFLEV